MSSRPFALMLILAFATSAFILVPLLTHAGWPYNHDGERLATRMAIVATHWRMGQAIPVWATTTVMGYGSPSPILYHKLFTYASATLYLLFGSVKPALVATLATFITIGFLGAGACVRAMQTSRNLLAESFAGFMVVSCNYATTDWLVRGADAEFAAMMLSPWFFCWCLLLIQKGQWSLWIGPLLAAIALAHSAIGLFFLVPLALCLLLGCLRWKLKARKWMLPAIYSLLLFLLVLLPFVLPMWQMLGYARVDDFLAPGYTPRTSHIQFLRFFWDKQWFWGGKEWGGFSPQLDTGLVVAFACFLPLLLRSLAPRSSLGPTLGWCGTFLGSTVLVMMVLQMKAALPLFEEVPGAGYIQFSWRLLLFVSVGLVLCGALTLDVLRAKGYVKSSVALGIVLMLSTITNKPWFTGMPRPWFDPGQFAASARTAHDTDAIEYTPRTPPEGWFSVMQYLRDLGSSYPYECSVRPLDEPDRERAASRFSATCDRPGRAALPAFLARGMRVDANGLPVDAVRTCDDPRAIVALPAGTSSLTIHFPTWWTVISWPWDHRPLAGTTCGAVSVTDADGKNQA